MVTDKRQLITIIYKNASKAERKLKKCFAYPTLRTENGSMNCCHWLFEVQNACHWLKLLKL